MSKATTLRLPEERLRLLKAIAGYEDRTLTKIFDELAEEYIERHRETLELLRIPGFLEECREGLEEIKSGGGKPLDELGS
jgi:predicted DNA-binding protein